MSFRARLTIFFFLTVVVPMAAMGLLVFGLIDGSAASRANARAAGIAATASRVYESSSTQSSRDAQAVARDLAYVPIAQLSAQAQAQLRTGPRGISAITVRVGRSRAVQVGSHTAIAPGVVVVKAAAGRPARTVSVSELTASQYARQLAGAGIQVVVRRGAVTLGSTLPSGTRMKLPAGSGAVAIGSRRYRAVTQTFAGLNGERVSVTVLSDTAVTSGSVADDRVMAAGFIVAFLLMALFFTMLASRALRGQMARFVDAARRLGGGDFSMAVQTTGRDEFAALGAEFNAMARQLRNRMDELEQERARVRASIRRIGDAFASGLDRDALLELALRTAMDATNADRGRVCARAAAGDPLWETYHLGDVRGLDQTLARAERDALKVDGVGGASVGDLHVASVTLSANQAGGPAHGIITVCRQGRRFSADDLELLRSLARRATLALANVNIHIDAQRQAITDDLTGLTSHGHFQELLEAAMHEVRRYEHPVGLAMIDIDDFKSINDTYGHQQGDLVLRYVAQALRETSRDVDVAARYGGEEMALILPHTDIEGAFELGERARTAIEQLSVPCITGDGSLFVTASVGVSASSDGRREALIAAADNALYVAKRTGKNRTVCAGQGIANELAGTAN